MESSDSRYNPFPMKPSSRSLAGVLTLAVLVHGGLLVAVHLKTGGLDFYAFQSLDGREYYAIAKNLLDHGVFSQDELPPLRPDTWRTPGYPFFLAAVMAFAGKSPRAMILAQQLLSILNVALLFGIARRWMTAGRAGVVTLLFLVEPYHLYYSLWLMSTTLQTTLVLAIWLVWGSNVRPRASETTSPSQGESWGEGIRSLTSIRPTAVLGVLCATLVATWPGAIFIPVMLFVGILRSRRVPNARYRQRLTCAAAFVAALACLVGAWMIRNHRAAGHLSLSHQSGIVLAYFKAAEVELWRDGRTADRYLETSLSPDRLDEPHPTWEAIDRQLRLRFHDLSVEQQEQLTWSNLAQGNKTSVDSFRISSELAWIGITRLFADPWSTSACVLTRVGQTLTFPLDLAVAPPNGVSVNRLQSAVVGAAYLLLAGMVLTRLIRGRVSFAAAYFPLACVVAFLLAATPQTDPRFRVPMIPFLVFLALLPVSPVTSDPVDPRADHRVGAKGERDK